VRSVTFSVPGDPVPQPRVRVSTQGGFARAYVPAKHPVHQFRRQLSAAAEDAGLTAIEGEPVEVIIDAVFARPKSHLTKKGVKPSAPVLPRPDADNIAKAVLDSLGEYFDDTLVRRLVVEKTYGAEGRTTVRIQ
jgi:Holliday junction resolvase RusA-like endonuclease